ncbi:hypothetical protein [Mycobacteroides abscessus]|uniref:hypothetical protein n=1 Tax=Mycobacteroides abscessus TaxID=36809 RepID=UPI00266D3ACB|nr:hypothetical protein [Mycobacteroides abscessus]MDO3331312.1 hypothetical protein [Mycobacteroides abscessus subsp. abscessus]
MTSDDTRLVDAITEALSVSLRADEPNWSTQRNWDAGDGLVIRRHAEKVAAAVKEAGFTLIAPDPRSMEAQVPTVYESCRQGALSKRSCGAREEEVKRS